MKSVLTIKDAREFFKQGNVILVRADSSRGFYFGEISLQSALKEFQYCFEHNNKEDTEYILGMILCYNSYYVLENIEEFDKYNTLRELAQIEESDMEEEKEKNGYGNDFYNVVLFNLFQEMFIYDNPK